MAFLLILVVYATAYTGVNYEPDDYSGYDDEAEIVIDNETHTVELPERPATFSIWSAAAILAILVAAIAVGIISGVSIPRFRSFRVGAKNDRKLYNLYGHMGIVVNRRRQIP